MSYRKLLNSLKYTFLSALIVIGATGVSNANPFTVTGEVCDTMERSQDTPGTLNSVSIVALEADEFTVNESTITMKGVVDPGYTATLPFDLDVTAPLQCDGLPSSSSFDYIDVDGVDVVVGDCLPSNFFPCSTFDTEVTADVTFPIVSGPYSTQITFTYTAF